jgi:subtilisin family serine protease
MKSVILVLDRSVADQVSWSVASRGRLVVSSHPGGEAMVRYAVIGAVLIAVAACEDSTSPRRVGAAPSSVNAAQSAAPNDYIVVLRNDEPDPDATADALVKAHGGTLTHVYRTAIKGFAVQNLPDAAVDALQRNPVVARIERDGIMTADDVQAPTPSWGLDRVDAIAGLDNSYTSPNDGSGVTAYIIDTGINPTSSDFTGRILSGVDFVDGGAPDDCAGHGTHVAGTVGGTTFGLAKNVKIVAVRVLNCAGSGTTSGVISGVDWVAANAIKPAVANMSLGGGASASLDQAVATAVAAGVTFAVAAGNSTASACNYSPAREPSAITVGATTSADQLASYSNFGTCVDINAPGSGITSDWIGSATATNTISGTSMASPHVAGAAALFLSANTNASPADVVAALTANATMNKLGTLPAGTPNKLLYVGFIGSGGVVPPPSGPVASFTKTCSGFRCTFTSTSTGTITLTSWVFSDGTTDSGTPVQHTFAPRKNYKVTLTVTDGTSPSSASQTVACNPKKCQ